MNITKTLLAIGLCLSIGQSLAQNSTNQAFSSHLENYFIIDGKGQDAKFQISIKYRIFDELLPEKADQFIDRALRNQQQQDRTKLFLTFTKKSLWDIGEASAPFKDSNFRTGLMLARAVDAADIHVGWEHESNGKDKDASRSVNRAYLRYRQPIPFIDNKKFKAGVTAWHITRESGNNRDIKDFVGNVEPFLEYQSSEGDRGKNCVLRLTGKKGSNSDRFGIQVDAEIPWAQIDGVLKINKRLGYLDRQLCPSFYLQFHDGYAEDLLDYNERSTEFRAGILLSY